MAYQAGQAIRGTRTSFAEKGLTRQEVEASRKKHGINRMSVRKGRGFFSHLLENFADPMIRILLIALAINIVFLFQSANWYETACIGIAVLLAVLISTLSEFGSESAFQRLQEEAARIRCRAIREGAVTEIPVEEIVVGDLVSLQPGDRIPADGTLGAGELSVDQSTLNGETKEAKKTAPKAALSPSKGAKDLLDPHRVFSGTVVCSGSGVMRVVAIGDRTLYGAIAGEVQHEKGKSPLKEKLGGLAKTISILGYIGAALAALTYLFNVFVLEYESNPQQIFMALQNPRLLYQHLLHAAMLAVTVIVMAVPEGLPMMITVVLSSNMGRMLKDNVLVRKLVGIETAGSLNILFTDKTGTLTQGKLSVTSFIDGTGTAWNDARKLHALPIWRELHSAIQYNCLSDMSEGKAVGGNPTDRALLEYVSTFPQTHRLTKGREFPFDSRVKFMATEVIGGTRQTFIKGAPEVILPHCGSYRTPDGRTVSLPNTGKAAKAIEAMQKGAARLVAVAVSDRTGSSFSQWGPLTLLGMFAVRDDVRGEAEEGISQIQQAGIQVVMITGDAKATAEAIAEQTGLMAGPDALALTSEELSRMSDAEIAGALPRLRVVARALPQDKSRLVRIAQSQGLVVGMTGDGVNDAPALKHADVGFAMGSGTEVAKEAGDIVILDDNLLSIAKAIRYGRTIFKSIRKFITFQLTLNLCAMGISIIAPLIGIDSPITVIQMLWINMVMDTLAGLAFAGEPALLEYMKEAPKRRDEPILNGYMWREIIFGALYAIALCLWFLTSDVSSNIARAHSETRAMTAFFALFMFMGIFNSFCARTHHINLLDHLAGNKAFITVMATVSIVQIGLLYFGGPVFRTNGLTASELGIVLGLSLTTVLMCFVRKAWYKVRGTPVGM